MSSCETVREALPVVLAGEPDEVGALAHVAACNTCRDEHDRLVRDLAGIRSALATLDVVPSRAAPAQLGSAAKRRPRELSWWTAGVGIAAIVAVGLLIGRGLHHAHGPRSPAAPGPVEQASTRFRDVAEIVARGDTPVLLQLRLESDGQAWLRWMRRGPGAAWTMRGPWTIGTARSHADWLTETAALRAALEEASPEPLHGGDVVSPKAPRLVIEADPSGPWRLVQHALYAATRAPLTLSRITYLRGGGEPPLDLDLPVDRASAGVVFPEEFGSVRLLRGPSAADPTRTVTRIRVFDDGRWLELAPPPLVPETPEAAALRRASERDLFATLTSSALAAVKRAAPVGPVSISIKTPPATGPLVPIGDVLRVAGALHGAGFATLHFEGPADLSPRGPR